MLNQELFYKNAPLFIAEACSLTCSAWRHIPAADVCGYRTFIVENDEGEKYHIAHRRKL